MSSAVGRTGFERCRGIRVLSTRRWSWVWSRTIWSANCFLVCIALLKSDLGCCDFRSRAARSGFGDTICSFTEPRRAHESWTPVFSPTAAVNTSTTISANGIFPATGSSLARGPQTPSSEIGLDPSVTASSSGIAGVTGCEPPGRLWSRGDPRRCFLLSRWNRWRSRRYLDWPSWGLAAGVVF